MPLPPRTPSPDAPGQLPGRCCGRDAARSTIRTGGPLARPACRGRQSFRSRLPSPRVAVASPRGCTRGRRPGPPERIVPGTGVSSTAGAVPTGVALTRRSQLPPGGGSERAALAVGAAASRARSRSRAYTVTSAPTLDSPSQTARAAPPAPTTAARAPFSSSRPHSGSRKPATSLFMPTQPVAHRRSVFTAPTRSATESRSFARLIRASLNGAVTLRPRAPNASAKAKQSSASAASSGRYTASRFTAWKAALCMHDDNECMIGLPTTPYSSLARRQSSKPELRDQALRIDLARSGPSRITPARPETDRPELGMPRQRSPCRSRTARSSACRTCWPSCANGSRSLRRDVRTAIFTTAAPVDRIAR